VRPGRMGEEKEEFPPAHSPPGIKEKKIMPVGP
jgi:hypothetical protein